MWPIKWNCPSIIKLVARSDLLALSLLYPTFTSRAIALHCPVCLTGSCLFFEPLAGQIRISPQSPVVVVIYAERVYVPGHKEQHNIDEASVNFVGCFNAHQLHFAEVVLENLLPVFLWLTHEELIINNKQNEFESSLQQLHLDASRAARLLCYHYESKLLQVPLSRRSARFLLCTTRAS